MEKEFVPYELAVKLKELGFDEPCLTCYDKLEMIASHSKNVFDYKNYNTSGYMVSRPTFSQAFRWFREKYNAVCEIIRREDKNHSTFIGWVYIDNRKIDVVSYWDSKTYEEAELACLTKLIEIVQGGNNE